MNQKIMRQLGHIDHLRRRVFHRVIEKEISWGQPQVLLFLANNDGAIQREIASFSGTKAPTVSKVLDTMEKSGMIERAADADDRRVMRIFLTQKGRQASEKVNELFDNVDQACLSGLSAEELLSLSGYLDRIEKNIRTLDEGKDEDFI